MNKCELKQKSFEIIEAIALRCALDINTFIYPGFAYGDGYLADNDDKKTQVEFGLWEIDNEIATANFINGLHDALKEHVKTGR